jgi:hypothetical protein
MKTGGCPLGKSSPASSEQNIGKLGRGQHFALRSDLLPSESAKITSVERKSADDCSTVHLSRNTPKVQLPAFCNSLRHLANFRVEETFRNSRNSKPLAQSPPPVSYPLCKPIFKCSALHSHHPGVMGPSVCAQVRYGS